MTIRYTATGQKAHQINPAHYNGALGKSQWKPRDGQREYQLFCQADAEGWTDGTTDYWAIECQNGNANALGRDQADAMDCRIARFRQDAQASPWHGYPITLTRQGEKLPPSVWSKWFGPSGLRRAWKQKLLKRQI